MPPLPAERQFAKRTTPINHLPMKIAEGSIPPSAPCRTAEQATSEEEALQRGMAEKSKEFVEKGAEVYTTA